MATLEEIEQKLKEVREKIPGIKAGIEALSASDLVEGAGGITPQLPSQAPQDSTPDAYSAITGAGGTSALFTQMSEQLTKMGEQREKAEEQQRSLWEKLTAKPVKSQAELLQNKYEE